MPRCRLHNLTMLFTSLVFGLAVPTDLRSQAVTASLAGRTLQIVGNGAQNNVTLAYYPASSPAVDHFWVVSSSGGFSGAALVNASDIVANDIDLDAGNDNLIIGRFPLYDAGATIDLSILLGSGDDYFEMGEAGYTSNLFRVAGNVAISGDSGPG